MATYEAHGGVEKGCVVGKHRRNVSNLSFGGSPDRVGQGRPIRRATKHSSW